MFRPDPVRLAFEVVLQLASNVREEDGAIVGDLGRDGAAEAAVETLIRRGTFVPPMAGARPAAGTDAVFRVWLADGNVSRLAIDLTRTAQVTRGARAGAGYIWRRSYVTDFTGVGTTAVDVTPELRTVFSGLGLVP